MKRDLKRHRLLEILSARRVKFEADQLNDKILGTSFEDLLKSMNCDILELNLIASELYNNKEIEHHNTYNINGLYCKKEGLTSFANNKYKVRFWSNIWSKLLTVSQIVVPIMALAIALVTILDSQQSREQTAEIQQLREQLHELQIQQDFQTNTISNLTNILKSDSLQTDLKIDK